MDDISFWILCIPFIDCSSFFFGVDHLSTHQHTRNNLPTIGVAVVPERRLENNDD
jgi:hypothetical protein